MWIDKDDIFADDKVQEFKTTNPTAETHLRQACIISTPQPHTPLPHHLHHTLITYPMSSDGRSDLAVKYPAGAIADDIVPYTAMATDLAEALRHFPCVVPGRVSPDFMLKQSTTMPPPLELPGPRVEVASAQMESRIPAEVAETAGVTPFILTCPLSSASDDTCGICPHCKDTLAYCYCDLPIITIHN
jgi:hypothetical protein